eukprot:GAHX01000858.1.p2 GENE.GAHX01000858.1~~GAHX01000858.1.p2  ORF type:complete len:53 (+),score=7.60 GAHX01000858.1:109-267(+)
MATLLNYNSAYGSSAHHAAADEANQALNTYNRCYANPEKTKENLVSSIKITH